MCICQELEWKKSTLQILKGLNFGFRMFRIMIDLKTPLCSNLLPWEATLPSTSVCSKPLPAFKVPCNPNLEFSVFIWDGNILWKAGSCLLGLGAGIGVWNLMMCSVWDVGMNVESSPPIRTAGKHNWIVLQPWFGALNVLFAPSSPALGIFCRRQWLWTEHHSSTVYFGLFLNISSNLTAPNPWVFPLGGRK